MDGNLDLDTRLDADRGDLFHNLGRGLHTNGRSAQIQHMRNVGAWGLEVCDTHMKINEALVNPHFETIVRVGTLAAWRLTRGNTQDLCRHANRALDLQLLVLGAVDQVLADLLQRLD